MFVVMVMGCSNILYDEKDPPLLPDIWFITSQGIEVMSEKPDTLLTLLDINIDSLGALIDSWNSKMQKILLDDFNYDKQYLSSSYLKVLFAELKYINKWHKKSVKANGIYIRTEKVAVTNLWWELNTFNKFNGDNSQGFQNISKWTLIHELVHYYQQCAGKDFSECEANAVREYFFYGIVLHPDCE